MQPWRLAARNFLRSLHAGRLTVLLIALTVAVAAVTTVGFFIDRVRLSVEIEAASALAADLRLSAEEPLNPEYLAEAGRLGLRTAEFATLLTVVLAADTSQLSTVYAVNDAYPLRGRVRIADGLDGETYFVDGGPPAGGVWVEAGLMERLGVGVGDVVSIGVRDFTVDRVLKHRPDQAFGFETFAPSLLMSLADLDSTELIRPGSRFSPQLISGRQDSLFGARAAALSKRVWREAALKLPDTPRIRMRSPSVGDEHC